MKVYPTIGNVTYLERSRKNGDATQKDQGNSDGYRKQERPQDEQSPEPSYEQISQAVEAFTSDPSLQGLGLEAQVEGTGPGLKVTLKDGQGGKVRQLTGQEFLQMRESGQVTGRGKLLDRKA